MAGRMEKGSLVVAVPLMASVMQQQMCPAFPDLPQLPSQSLCSKLSLGGASEKLSSARTEEKYLEVK